MRIGDTESNVDPILVSEVIDGAVQIVTLSLSVSALFSCYIMAACCFEEVHAPLTERERLQACSRRYRARYRMALRNTSAQVELVKSRHNESSMRVKISSLVVGIDVFAQPLIHFLCPDLPLHIRRNLDP